MRTNRLTVTVGIILAVIFVLLLFTFQVRQTEVAVVTTFDKPSRTIDEPGLKFKLPYPIQKVHKFDKRIQNFEDDFEETYTLDRFNMLAMVYVGWTIASPSNYFNNFPSAVPEAAHPALKGLIRSSKNAVIGGHNFSEFISTDSKQMKFAEIENEMLQAIKGQALQKYGIEVKFLGIKKLGLPESVTQKVFDRMTAERQRQVESLKAQGEAEAMRIKSAADTERNKLLAAADGKAKEIRGQADSEAAKHYATLNGNPDLAMFLLQIDALDQLLKNKATLILDKRTSPLNLLDQGPTATTGQNR